MPMVEKTHCPTCTRATALTDEEKATLRRARRQRQFLRIGLLIVSATVLGFLLIFDHLFQPFSSMLIAAALATTIAPLLVPPRARKSNAKQSLPSLARVWVGIFALAFGGYEAATIANRHIDLERRRSCNETAAAILYRQSASMNETRTVTCRTVIR